MNEAHLFQAAAAQLREVSSRTVVQRKLSERLGVCRKRCRECLADRADLEQRIACDRFASRLCGNPEVVEFLLPMVCHRDGHARHAVLAQVGRASGRESGCRYVSISGVAGSLKKQIETQKERK